MSDTMLDDFIERYSQARCYDGSADAAGCEASHPKPETTPDSHTPSDSRPAAERNK